MKKDEIFLTDNSAVLALTSTSANHICNLAKEYLQEKQLFLDSVKFHTKEIELISDSSKKTVEYGYSENDIPAIEATIDEIARITSLIAWLREAISAKQSILNEIKSYTLQQYCEDRDIELPVAPTMKESLDSNDVIASLGIKERNNYYHLETQASVIGKFIHPKQPFSEERKLLSSIKGGVCSYDNHGRDTILTYVTPTITIEEANELFFKLQKQHREVQSRLNSIKQHIQDAVRESEIACQTEYDTQYAEYSSKYNKLNGELNEFKLNETKRIGRLKIVIPDSLLSAYNMINSLGK